jgi:transposase InsO family protein
MNIHSRARLTIARRAELVDRVRIAAWRPSQAAKAAEVTGKTARKWVGRYAEGGAEALRDRSSRPKRQPRLTEPARAEIVCRLRECRMTGPAIASALRMPRSTVAMILKRAGLGRLGPLEPPPPIKRYERKRPGDLIHVDVKKLGRIERVGHRVTGDRRDRTRGAGWECVHVAIDDFSRLAYVEVLPNECADTTIAFLKRAVAFYERHGVTVRSVMSDNGSAYVSRDFALACQQLQLRHLRTKPYTPRTNGKAERFIQTMLREWAYVMPFDSSASRTRALPSWTTYYNRIREHGGINGMTPLSRITSGNNVSGNHT